MFVIEYFSRWEAWAIAATLLGIAGLVFWWCVHCRNRKVRATALYFMDWFATSTGRQGRRWEKAVIEAFTEHGTDFARAMLLAEQWHQEVADEDTDPYWGKSAP